MFMFVIQAFSQNGVRNPVERNTVVQYLTRGQLLTFTDAQPRAKGSLYLYDKWKNIGVIEFNDGQKALTKNINYNIDTNMFESIFAKDSTHNYNLETIREITLNNKRYKQFKFKKEKKVFEIIFEDPNFSLLKSYSIHVYKASKNPMVNITHDTYKQREHYFIKKGNSIEAISLNKKHVLKILNSKGIAESDAKKLAKEKNLSFKNEFDVQMLFKHYL